MRDRTPRIGPSIRRRRTGLSPQQNRVFNAFDPSILHLQKQTFPLFVINYRLCVRKLQHPVDSVFNGMP